MVVNEPSEMIEYESESQPRETMEVTQPDTPKHLFRLNQYDPASGAVGMQFITELEITVVGEDTLGDIRKRLVDRKALDTFHSGSPFCDVSGTVVSDDITLPTYEGLVQASIHQNKGGVEVREVGNEDAAPSTRGQATPKVKDIYYRKRRILGRMTKTAKDSLDRGSELTSNLAAFSKTDPTQSRSLHNPNAGEGAKMTYAPPSTFASMEVTRSRHPADLTEHEWSVITRTNRILSGSCLVVDEKPGRNGNVLTMKVRRSPYNVFNLKARKLEEYEVSAPSKVAVENGEGCGHLEAIETALHIPCFWVDDGSYVTAVETKNSLQQSMANHSFSEKSIERSVHGSFWGAFSSNIVWSKSDGRRDKLIIRYNLPRVSVLLDSSSLEISEECQNDLDKLSDINSYIKFGKKYGHVFARRVELGGQLSFSEFSNSNTKEKVHEQFNSMKRRAALSISSYVQAPQSDMHQGKEGNVEKNVDQSFHNSVMWEAKGGNTLLLPTWCATVDDFYNWRVIQRHDVVPLYKVLSQFPKYQNLARRFEAALGDKVSTIRFKLTEITSQKPLQLFENDQAFSQHIARNAGSLENKEVLIQKIGSTTGFTSIRVDSSSEGIQIWEAQVPKCWFEEAKIFYRVHICIKPSGIDKYLSVLPSTVGSRTRGQFPYYLAMRDKKTTFWFRKPGWDADEMDRPLQSGDVVEIGLLEPHTDENLGLATELHSNNGLVSAEQYDGTQWNSSPAFKFEYVVD